MPLGAKNYQSFGFACKADVFVSCSNEDPVEVPTLKENDKLLSLIVYEWKQSVSLPRALGCRTKAFQDEADYVECKGSNQASGWDLPRYVFPIGRRTIQGVHTACSYNRTRPRSSRLACSSIAISGKRPARRRSSTMAFRVCEREREEWSFPRRIRFGSVALREQ